MKTFQNQTVNNNPSAHQAVAPATTNDVGHHNTVTQFRSKSNNPPSVGQGLIGNCLNQSGGMGLRSNGNLLVGRQHINSNGSSAGPIKPSNQFPSRGLGQFTSAVNSSFDPTSAQTKLSATNVHKIAQYLKPTQFMGPTQSSGPPTCGPMKAPHDKQQSPAQLDGLKIIQNHGTPGTSVRNDANPNLLAGRKDHLSTAGPSSLHPHKSDQKEIKCRNTSSANLKSSGSQSALLTDKKQSQKPTTSYPLTTQNPNKGVSPSSHLPTTGLGALFANAQNVGGGRNTVVIHVCDEAKKKTQDFKCDRILLLEHMKYFNKYLAGHKNLDEIDISVHCDITIFDWLMKFVHGAQPSIEIKTAVSILISSDFLQMAPLVQTSLEYMAQHLQEIILLPIDMNCMNSALVKRLAKEVSVKQIHELNDRKDKLRSKLFMKKLELLLEDRDTSLQKCATCHKLFTRSQRDWQKCEKVKIVHIDVAGQTHAKHTVDKSWDTNKFVQFLRSTKKLEWPMIFWKMYAQIVDFYCVGCDERFEGATLNMCSYHPVKSFFGYNQNMGFYSCCYAESQRFAVDEKRGGCKTRPHIIDGDLEANFDYWTIQKMRTDCCEPYVFQKVHYGTGATEVVCNNPCGVDVENCLSTLMKEFRQETIGDDHVEEVEDWIDCSDSSDCDSEDDMYEGFEETPNGLFRWPDALQAKQTEQCSKMFQKRAKYARKCQFAKFRQWAKDFLQEHDKAQMEMITTRLQKSRCENPRPLKRKAKANCSVKEQPARAGSEMRAATRENKKRDAMSRGLRGVNSRKQQQQQLGENKE